MSNSEIIRKLKITPTSLKSGFSGSLHSRNKGRYIMYARPRKEQERGG
jgi:hypothetical protein